MSSTHQFLDRSTRPLLDRKQNQPQPLLLTTKKSDYRVHGFNDFTFVAKLYKDTNTKCIGYPYYGSPPSPTGTAPNKTDFIFSDDNSSENGGNDKPGYHSNIRLSQESSRKNYQYSHHIPSSNINTDQIDGPFIFGIDPSQHNESHRFRPLPQLPNSTVIVKQSAQYSNKENIFIAGNKRSKSATTKKDERLKTKLGTNNSKSDKKTKDKDSNKTIKCVLVGDGAVGKSNLIFSYLENRFIREHIPTASDIYNFNVFVNGKSVQVTLCDTAGQDNLDSLRQLSYPDCNVFLLCFSIVQPDSFHAVKHKWAPKFFKSNASLLLIGTQSDLRTDSKTLTNLQMQGLRPISSSDGWDLASMIGAKYIETSSALKIGVKDAFDTAIWDALLMTNSKYSQTKPLWKKIFCL